MPVAEHFEGADVLSWKDSEPTHRDLIRPVRHGKDCAEGSCKPLHHAGAPDSIDGVGRADARSVSQVSRAWNDIDRDYVVDGDPLNPALNGELGASPNANFGRRVTNFRLDPDWATGFGTCTYYNGVDVTVNGRLPHGGLLQGAGGPAPAILDPECHKQGDWLPQVKLIGSYPLPCAFRVSGTYQTLVLDPITNGTSNLGFIANYLATNAVVAPSLGRPLSAAANVTINLLGAGEQYDKRTHQIDLRFTRTFEMGRSRLQANIDLYKCSTRTSSQRATVITAPTAPPGCGPAPSCPRDC